MPRLRNSGPPRSAYHHLYNTAAWKQRRLAQLDARPLCELCEREGRVTPATVADHTEPHKGDPEKFFSGPLASLCKAHHDGAKQSQERTGLIRGSDSDGRPLDPRHPWSRAARRGAGV